MKDRTSGELRIALVQQSAGEDRETNIERGLQAMRLAANQGARLVAFPELAFDRFLPRTRCPDCPPRHLAESIPGPTTDRFARLAEELGVVVVLNLYEVDEEGHCFDSSPVIDADGSLLGIARMVHITQYPGFWEQDYYHPGDRGAPVFDTAVGRIGVSICYDRHFPEYMRALGVAGAELVVVPQAGTQGEWPEGMYEAELRVTAFHNGYFAALCNRVGQEHELDFAGESFVSDPEGVVLARASSGEDDLLIVDLDLDKARDSTARELFMQHRRPELYSDWIG